LGSFLFQKKDTIHFFVNHWPSRRGGEEESQPRRMKVAQTIRNIVDSLLKVNIDSKIIIVGDFNDEPTNISITETLKAQPFFCDSLEDETMNEDFETNLFNLSYKAWFDGMGSFFYQSDFNMLDQIIYLKLLRFTKICL
jgi:exonuclease III